MRELRCREPECPREVPSSYMDECLWHYNIRKFQESGKRAPDDLKKGKRFGRLKLTERGPDALHWNEFTGFVGATAQWWCQCDCGNRVLVRRTALLFGKERTRSCGCLTLDVNRQRTSEANPAFQNLTGQRFNRLTVIERAGTSSDEKVLWDCVCDCGAEVVVRAGSLKSGNTKSCGCLNSELASENMKRNRKLMVPKKKLTDQQIADVLTLYNDGVPQWKLGEMYGVSQATISHYVNGT